MTETATVGAAVIVIEIVTGTANVSLTQAWQCPSNVSGCLGEL